jgi:ribosomal protein S18 acetylase RimI-like enzyme
VNVDRSDVRFEAFDATALAEWLVEARTSYVVQRIEAGDSPGEAEANATRSLDQLVPGGSPAPGQLIGRVRLGDETVGRLWLGPAGSDPARWWIWDVAIHEDLRGRGLGRQVVLLAEELARSHGAITIGLNVFGQNHIARGLYTSLGYREQAVQMRKSLQ